ncbi:YbaB/EbfC family nucleoid-associated protein [Rhodococcus sp. NPDC057297]|uniref:YbaB/EbfC family nucleoid-associated protein n=1 Tax=Rhodococcus sp. NPDC057297 TaxID=3346090 RepID=UPI00362CDA2C
MTDRIDMFVARAERALDTLHGASEALASLQVTRRTEDGNVSVTVDGSGAMTELELASDLRGESARDLEKAIVELSADAAREALERRAAIVDRMQSSLSET